MEIFIDFFWIFSVFKDVPSVMVPTFWFEQYVELDEGLARQAIVN